MGCFIVAEIGVNHNGDFDTALKLIDAADECRVNAVKFQLWQPETFPHLEYLRLSNEQIHELSHYAMRNNLEWFCAPFDIPSVEFLESIGMTIWKIPSNRVVWDNKEMLKRIDGAKCAKWIIISNGLKYERYPIRGWAFHGRVTWLYCISKYPVPEIEIDFLSRPSPCEWGFSDHSTCIFAPVVAVYKGACYIEKHLTLDRNQEGPDHKASLEPVEFKRMVEMVREVEGRVKS